MTLAYQTLAEIAGNDAGRRQAFVAEVRQHQLRLRAFFQRAIQEAALGDEGQGCAATCLGGYGFRDFDAVPRFRASARRRGWRRRRCRRRARPRWRRGSPPCSRWRCGC